jgi:hypothetical protein
MNKHSSIPNWVLATVRTLQQRVGNLEASLQRALETTPQKHVGCDETSLQHVQRVGNLEASLQRALGTTPQKHVGCHEASIQHVHRVGNLEASLQRALETTSQKHVGCHEASLQYVHASAECSLVSEAAVEPVSLEDAPCHTTEERFPQTLLLARLIANDVPAPVTSGAIHAVCACTGPDAQYLHGSSSGVGTSAEVGGRYCARGVSCRSSDPPSLRCPAELSSLASVTNRSASDALPSEVLRSAETPCVGIVLGTCTEFEVQCGVLRKTGHAQHRRRFCFRAFPAFVGEYDGASESLPTGASDTAHTVASESVATAIDDASKHDADANVHSATALAAKVVETLEQGPQWDRAESGSVLVAGFVGDVCVKLSSLVDLASPPAFAVLAEVLPSALGPLKTVIQKNLGAWPAAHYCELVANVARSVSENMRTHCPQISGSPIAGGPEVAHVSPTSYLESPEAGCFVVAREANERGLRLSGFVKGPCKWCPSKLEVTMFPMMRGAIWFPRPSDIEVAPRPSS